MLEYLKTGKIFLDLFEKIWKFILIKHQYFIKYWIFPFWISDFKY